MPGTRLGLMPFVLSVYCQSQYLSQLLCRPDAHCSELATDDARRKKDPSSSPVWF
jgi:hypothetical protein